MNLSKEAIEAIEKIANRVTKERIQNEEDFTEFADPNQKLDAAYVQDFANVVSESLTNPEIFEKAGLISLDDAMQFAEWYAGQDTWEGDRYREVSEMFQIYKQENQ